MASSFAGGFARGFQQQYVENRRQEKQLENDIFRDSWSRYQDGLKTRQEQQKFESGNAEVAALYAGGDKDKEAMFTKLLNKGVTTRDKFGDWLKQNDVQITGQSTAPSVPAAPTAPTPGKPAVISEMNELTPPSTEMTPDLVPFDKRGAKADPAARRTNAIQNRTASKIAKYAGVSPEEVKDILYGSSTNSPADMISGRIIPKTPDHLKLLANLDGDNYRAVALAAAQAGDTKTADLAMTIGGSLQKRADKKAEEAAKPYKEVWMAVPDENGNMKKGIYFWNGTSFYPKDAKDASPIPTDFMEAGAIVLDKAVKLGKEEGKILSVTYVKPVMEKKEGFHGVVNTATMIKEVFKRNSDAASTMAGLAEFLAKAKAEGGVIMKVIQRYQGKIEAGETIDVDAAKNEIMNLLPTEVTAVGEGASELQALSISLTFKFLQSLGQTGPAAGQKDFNAVFNSIYDTRSEFMLKKVGVLVKSSYDSVVTARSGAFEMAAGTIYEDYLPNNLGDNARTYAIGDNENAAEWLSFDPATLAEQTFGKGASGKSDLGRVPQEGAPQEAAKPTANTPPPNGATVRDKRTGKLFRVENGQLVPMGE